MAVVNRQRMKNKLFALYQNWDAVNRILENSQRTLPENYLALCTEQPLTPQGETLRTVRETKLMTLPCSNETDARSVAVQTLPRGTQLEITSVIHNTRGSEWYAVNFGLETRYVYSGADEESAAGNSGQPYRRSSYRHRILVSVFKRNQKRLKNEKG